MARYSRALSPDGVTTLANLSSFDLLELLDDPKLDESVVDLILDEIELRQEAGDWKEDITSYLTKDDEDNEVQDDDTTVSVWNMKTNKFEKIKKDDTTDMNFNSPVKTAMTPASTSTKAWNNNTPKTPTYVADKHDGDVVIFTENFPDEQRREFVIADYIGCKVGTADVCLDLNNNLSTTPSKVITHGPAEYQALNEYTFSVAPKIETIVKFDWPDMSTVNAPLDFWLKLLETLPKNGRIMITCHGGHGRSGTCMAAILIASGMCSGDAMAYVRGMHCKKAIESMSQEDYLLMLATEAAERGINKTPGVEDAYIWLTRDDGKFATCMWCGRNFKQPEETNCCNDCWKDGYRDNGVLDELHPHIKYAKGSSYSSTGYYYGDFD